MMTVHKLTAGDGYTYLTRQVASADEYRSAGQSLAEYYVARGNPPGMWMGRGAAQLGLEGAQVSEAQMKALFGEGRHPDRDAMEAAGHSPAATKLGAAYPSYADLAPYPQRVADAVNAFAEQNSRPPSATERNRIAAKEARRGRRAVAGYDLVFTPVKSASLLWALGGPEMRQAVEDAHHEAVASALGWIEQHAAYTRSGHGGTAQIDATGLVCAAFDHRESRSGDPDLHTHVAVANKVCGVDGKWRSLDARNLYALGVAASERYNTRFEDALARRCGVSFEDRPGGAAGKRPVREISGMPLELIRHFSRRRAAIESRYAELRGDYRTDHGREPDRATQLKLAQQATLETREGKAPGRALAEQVADWTAQARIVLGERRAESLPHDCTGRAEPVCSPDEDTVHELARQVVRQVAEQRSTWTVWNLHAEAERVMRPLRFASVEQREAATEAVIAHATSPDLTIRLAAPDLIAEPQALVRRSDGQSVFVPHGSERFTTSEVLLAEDSLVEAGQRSDGPRVDQIVLQAALAIHEATTGVELDAGQHDVVARFATSPARIAVGIGPAGSGKTTAMRAFADVWQANGGRVVPLASSSKAAQVLGAELGERAENLHKFLHENRESAPRDHWFALRSGDVVLVDEAGMAGTLHLARLLELAAAAGASVRLLGDPAQLASVDAGGALRLLEREVGAAYLTDLHRFTDPAEGEATLQLRAGDPSALAFYHQRGRIETGSRDTMLELAYDHWARDIRSGKTAVLVAAASDDVTALNARARTERVAAGQVELNGIELHDGNLAGVGDWVVTRSNARTLRYRRTRWVHNGDTWRVLRRHSDGALTVEHLQNGGRVRLGSDYVADSVELAYAATAHRVQGMTTDAAHALVTSEMTREALYVASTRGREKTTWYAATEDVLDADCHVEPDAPRTADELLGAVLARTGAENSATETLRGVFEEANSLRTLVSRYDHARSVAASEALLLALKRLPLAEQHRILSDSAAPQLARTVATAAGLGANSQQLILSAFELDDMSNVRSPALVLATRIEDFPRALGVPEPSDPNRPLPWLSGPDVGHPGWLPYLSERAALIQRRAAELLSLTAAYREQYGVADKDATSLGEPPEPGSRRAAAYLAAVMSSTAERGQPAQRARTSSAQSSPTTEPPTHSMSQQRGPRLSR